MTEPRRLFPLVFAGGFTGLFLQIQAGRALSVHYGSTAITWGSILSVFMITLAAGYYVAGQIASRQDADNVLWYALACCLSLALPVLFLEDVVRTVTSSPVPILARPFATALVGYGPTGFLLGFFSPLAVEFVRMEDGEAAGTVYFVGTLGSICGALTTTFVLVPVLGTVTSFAVVVALLIVAAIPLVPRRRRLADVAVVAVLVFGAVAAASAGGVGALVDGSGSGSGPPVADGEVVYQTQTPYQPLRVVDRNGERVLYLSGVTNSAIDLSNDSRYVYRFYEFFHAPVLHRDSSTVSDVLVIGGGAGVLARRYAELYGADVDVVEVDPVVRRVAHQYFDAGHPNVTWHTADGRAYLRRTDERYDVVLIDAYSVDGVPAHLTTVEFHRTVRAHLRPDGVVGMNVNGPVEGPAAAFLRRETATMSRVYGSVTVYPPRPEAPRQIQNVVAVAHAPPRPSNATIRRRARLRPTPQLTGREFVAVSRTPAEVGATDAEPLYDETVSRFDTLPPELQRRLVNQSAPGGASTASPAPPTDGERAGE